MPATTDKKKNSKKKSAPPNYEKIGEYFPAGRRKGMRFGTMILDDGTPAIMLTPIEKGADGKVFSVFSKFGKPVNVLLDARRVKTFAELFDQTRVAAKARME